MDTFFATTFNSRLYKEYAHNFLETYLKTDQEIPVICYVDDDFDYPVNQNISYVKLHKAMPQILDFKDFHIKYLHKFIRVIQIKNLCILMLIIFLKEK